MKKFIKIVLGLVVLVVVLVAGVFYLTADLPKTANAFFNAISSGDFETAKTHLSEGFKKETSDQKLKDFLRTSTLQDYAEASWSSRSISGSQGELEGAITTKTGGVVPVKITLIKEQGSWKILYISRTFAGINGSNKVAKLPPVETRVALVKETMSRIAKAINSNSFSDLHTWMSSLWQQQFAVTKLETIFEPFVKQSIDLQVLDSLDPVFKNEGQIGEDGVLRLAGNYPTQPSKVDFELSYVLEGDNWKVVGLSVNVG